MSLTIHDHQAVWVDPVCGDGICEAPWEFASYSTFGCRADCGRLQDIQNLTKLQIDLYWDFSHPVGSIPASVSPGLGSSRVLGSREFRGTRE